jgi:hypothetical protein
LGEDNCGGYGFYDKFSVAPETIPFEDFDFGGGVYLPSDAGWLAPNNEWWTTPEGDVWSDFQ